MALRGKKPATIQKRFKGLLFGPPGVGKTMAAIQFPRPYLIDCERGAENNQYVEMLSAAKGLYFQTVNPEELISEVTSLLSETHPYQTVIIDPLTVIYNDLLDKSATSLITEADSTGTAFARHKGGPDRKIKHLLNLLLRLDMNVIITSHAKTKWERSGKELVDMGQTYDCYAKLDYLFDLVFEIQKRGTTDRVGIVRKTRVEGFPDGDIFPFSYDEIAKRYGRADLERDSVAVDLATPEQVATLDKLLADRVNGAELLEKWLTKAMADSPAEMNSDTIAKCITFLGGAVIPEVESV